MSSYIDTIVVGGGQAGLSVSWHLKQAGREHIVLDRGRIGGRPCEGLADVGVRHVRR